jgi:hypothetical protein
LENTISQEDENPYDPEPPSLRGRLFARLRYEFALEAAVGLACFALAFGLTLKISIAIVMMCLKFAVPDWVTAYLVLRADPDRWHGVGVSLLFVAAGFARASFFAITALLFSAMTIIPLLNGLAPRNALGAGAATALVCAYFFLLGVFPFAFAAALVARVSGTKLEFARRLTKLRRSTDIEARKIHLEVENSLALMSYASAVSLSGWVVSTLFFTGPNALPGWVGLIYLLMTFGMPFLWIWFFVVSTSPIALLGTVDQQFFDELEEADLDFDQDDFDVGNDRS